MTTVRESYESFEQRVTSLEIRVDGLARQVSLLSQEPNMAQVQLTEQQRQLAQQLGIDWTKIDFAKVLQLIQLFVSFFGGSAPVPAQATAGGSAATVQLAKGAGAGRHRDTLKAAGCPDADVDGCCACMEAGNLALQAAAINFAHCGGCCSGGGNQPAAAAVPGQQGQPTQRSQR